MATNVDEFNNIDVAPIERTPTTNVKQTKIFFCFAIWIFPRKCRDRRRAKPVNDTNKCLPINTNSDIGKRNSNHETNGTLYVRFAAARHFHVVGKFFCEAATEMFWQHSTTGRNGLQAKKRKMVNPPALATRQWHPDHTLIEP